MFYYEIICIIMNFKSFGCKYVIEFFEWIIVSILNNLYISIMFFFIVGKVFNVEGFFVI